MARTAPFTEPDLVKLDGDPIPGTPVKRGPGRPRKNPDAPPATRAPRGNQGKIAARTPTGQIMSEAEMIATVREEIYMWLSMGVGMWEAIDEECASVLLEPVRVPAARGMAEVERLEAITDRMVAIIARNKKTLAYLAKTGILKDIFMLGSLLMPVAKTVYKNHAGGGHGKANQDADLAQYGPYRPGA